MIAGFSAASASVTTKRIDDRRTAEKRDELASFKLIKLHSVPCQPGAGLQDIELARISQEVAERFYNLLAVGEGGRRTRRRLNRRQSLLWADLVPANPLSVL